MRKIKKYYCNIKYCSCAYNKIRRWFVIFYKSKTNTAVLQLALKRAGVYDSEIDGVFGPLTRNGIERLQKENNLQPTGEADYSVLNILLPYLSGYIMRKTEAGNTYYTLAQKYNTTVEAIKTANPGKDENNLKIGEILVIPISDSVTVTDMDYNSYLIDAVARGIAARYPFVRLIPIARSVWGSMIYLMKIGKGTKQMFVNASHHANEWITTPVVFKFVEDYAKAYASGGAIGQFSAEELYNNTTLFAVAAVNPDGIDIVNDAVGAEMLEQVKEIADNYSFIPFPSGWKANAAGTDLNLNYPAGWEEAKKIKAELGFVSPAPRDFVGASPLDQPESVAMYNITVANNFLLTLSYHTQGAVIYWKYLDIEPENAERIGRTLADASGYTLEATPTASGYAGYKDWFILTYNRPGYTVEAGLGENPLPIGDFEKIYKDNLPLMASALNEVKNMQ